MKQLLLIIAMCLALMSCGGSKHSTSTTGSIPQSTENSNISYQGGDGSSYEQAIIIKGAKGSFDGIDAEYAYLKQQLGQRGVDWAFISQALTQHEGKSYDILTVKDLSKNKVLEYHFDISDFFGKF